MPNNDPWPSEWKLQWSIKQSITWSHDFIISKIEWKTFWMAASTSIWNAEMSQPLSVQTERLNNRITIDQATLLLDYYCDIYVDFTVVLCRCSNSCLLKFEFHEKEIWHVQNIGESLSELQMALFV